MMPVVLAREIGDRFYEAWAMWDLALIDLAERRSSEALGRLRAALAAFDGMGDHSGPVLVLLGFALHARLAGDEPRHWLLRGAVERMRLETGGDLVRQRVPSVAWEYEERPPTADLQAAWDAGTAPAIESAVRGAAGDAFVVAVDVSANRLAFELSGPRARELLESGCPIDLHPRAFRAGSCAQTLLARANVLLHQVGDEPRYRIWIRPSFARYLAAWLTDAEVGLTPTV